MNAQTGKLMTLQEAVEAKARGEHVVELIGTEDDVRSISEAVKAQRAQERELATAKRRKRNKAARQSRKRNR